MASQVNEMLPTWTQYREWLGSLTYRDVRDRRFVRPTKLSVTTAGGELRFSYTFDDGPHAIVHNVERVSIERSSQTFRVRDGNADDVYRSDDFPTFAEHRGGHLVMRGHGVDAGITVEVRETIDADSRTFGFFIPMTNQSRAYEKSGRTFLVWRFRPGQRVRIHVPVEKYEDVFVLPSEAVVREGPEAYVFRQNGDLFKRLPVHVLHEDRRSIVIASDGSIAAGSYLAQSAAASLNRVLKAQTASGEQPGLHVHPDGTSHAAH